MGKTPTKSRQNPRDPVRVMTKKQKNVMCFVITPQMFILKVFCEGLVVLVVLVVVLVVLGVVLEQVEVVASHHCYRC